MTHFTHYRDKRFCDYPTIFYRRIEKNEGWAPAMFLREIATSRRNAREKGQHAVRAMLRDRLNTISAMTGKESTEFCFTFESLEIFLFIVIVMITSQSP